MSTSSTLNSLSNYLNICLSLTADSKANEGRGSDSSQNSGSTEAQNIESKISVIDSQTEQSCAQIQSNECLKDGEESKEEQKECSDVNPNDVQMRNAESLEDMSITHSKLPESKEEPSSSTDKAQEEEEKISFKLIFKKNNYDININSKTKVSDLKEQIQRLTSVAPSMQKLLSKGDYHHFIVIN